MTTIITLMVTYCDPELMDVDKTFNYRPLLSKTNLIRSYFGCLLHRFLDPSSFKVAFEMGYLDLSVHKNDKTTVTELIRDCREFLMRHFMSLSDLTDEKTKKTKPCIERLREFFAPSASPYKGQIPGSTLLIKNHMSYFEQTCDISFSTVICSALVNHHKLYFTKTSTTDTINSHKIARMMGFTTTEKIKSLGSTKSANTEQVAILASTLIQSRIKQTVSFGYDYAVYLFEEKHHRDSIPNVPKSNSEPIFKYLLDVMKMAMTCRSPKIIFRKDRLLDQASEYITGIKAYITEKGRDNIKSTSSGNHLLEHLTFLMDFLSQTKYAECTAKFDSACLAVENEG